MIENLVKIYSNKIILKVEKFDYNKYYYFYANNETDDIFGIEKTITENEYQLIKASYIEKKIYNNSNSLQKIYEYIFENRPYPFKNKKVKMLLIDSEYKDFKELLLSFYKEVELITIDDIYVAFCFDSYNNDISSFISTLSDDLGINFKLHEGINITDNTEGKIVRKYIGIVKNFLNNNEELYTDLSSVILNKDVNLSKEYAEIVNKCLLEQVLKDSIVKDIILTYFKNDLNVSKTAKDLYINRNSLLNKFEQIYKETGFNLQKFSHACAIYLLIIYKGNYK